MPTPRAILPLRAVLARARRVEEYKKRNEQRRQQMLKKRASQKPTLPMYATKESFEAWNNMPGKEKYEVWSLDSHAFFEKCFYSKNKAKPK